MNKVQIIIAATVLFLASCADNKEKDPEVADTNIAKETTIHCYQKVVGQDTMLLTLNKTGQKITGDLLYDFFEKDRSEGMIAGEMKGDTILAEYTYKAEGKESKRDVIFLMKEVDIVEGYGDVEEKDGAYRLKDRSKVTFTDTVLYRNVPCPPQK